MLYFTIYMEINDIRNRKQFWIESVTIIKNKFGFLTYYSFFLLLFSFTHGEYERFSLFFYLWNPLPPRYDDQRWLL